MRYTATLLRVRVSNYEEYLAVTGVFVVLAIAVIGCLYIFELMSYEYALSSLLKIVGATVLLGGCSALIAFLVRSKKEPPSQDNS